MIQAVIDPIVMYPNNNPTGPPCRKAFAVPLFDLRAGKYFVRKIMMDRGFELKLK
jgi:hypothetical protein